MGIPEKIKAIQDEIGRTQLNKATEHHIGLLKAKIAKLKREQEAIQIKKSSKKSDGFDVRRSGDATVVFIGLPSVGKSTLLNALTGSKSSVGAFQFTTVTVVPGILDYRGAKIQMLDLPGIIKGASSGKGLGKRILSVARSADIVLLVLDVFQPYHENVLINELSNIGIRLNPNTDAKTINQISTGKKEDKFGLTEKTFIELVKYAKNSKYVNLKCLSVHIGSQIVNNLPYEKMLKVNK